MHTLVLHYMYLEYCTSWQAHFMVLQIYMYYSTLTMYSNCTLVARMLTTFLEVVSWRNSCTAKSARTYFLQNFD